MFDDWLIFEHGNKYRKTIIIFFGHWIVWQFGDKMAWSSSSGAKKKDSQSRKQQQQIWHFMTFLPLNSRYIRCFQSKKKIMFCVNNIRLLINKFFVYACDIRRWQIIFLHRSIDWWWSFCSSSVKIWVFF